MCIIESIYYISLLKHITNFLNEKQYCGKFFIFDDMNKELQTWNMTIVHVPSGLHLSVNVHGVPSDFTRI